jgi:hypothetical protein
MWFVKKIKNKNSNYDFRLKPIIINNYSKTNFKKTNYFRILVSLADHLTNGEILASDQKNNKQFYKIKKIKSIPAIFDFTLISSNNKNKFVTINDNMNNILLNKNNNYSYINILYNEESRIFSSLFDFKSINNIKQFFFDNDNFYRKFKMVNSYTLITGWFKNNRLILDLIEYDKKYNSNNIKRCKIIEDGIIDYIGNSYKNVNGFCLFLVELDQNYSVIIKEIIPVTFDEYLTYLYSSMLPYKYDLNDKLAHKKHNIFKFDSREIERVAFAIDPDGSKDRDDAIGAFYLNNGNIVTSLDKATHIKLMVHIADTLDYIIPNKENYYYNYSKYKTTTDYLNKYNLPMMDRYLSEDILSLDGDGKNAITTSLIYKILDKDKFIISNVPEKVDIFRSSNLKIIGTTYNKFALSFDLKPENGFNNKNFIERLIIPCNKNVKRDYNMFIYEGRYKKKSNKIEKYVANNLKQLYIFFVNSLDHTGKDSLLKIPSTLSLEGKKIYLDFRAIDMWAHSLVEYTALETNIYFSHLMVLLNNGTIRKQSKLSFDYKDIRNLINNQGNKIQKKILNNILDNKKIVKREIGIFRNLYCSQNDHYLNIKTQKLVIKQAQKNKSVEQIINKMLQFYLSKEDKNGNNNFMKMLLSLRQIMLLINTKTNLDISEKIISNDLRMKAKYEVTPLSHIDVASYYYTHATSPMRRFVDINVHHLIFSKNRDDYIFNNINLDYTNKNTDIGKQIHYLVNSYRFLEFIKSNKDLVMNVKMIDPKRNSIGFIELINFFSFESTFGIKQKIKQAKIELDKYEFPILKTLNNKEKVFNIFFYMLRREDKKIRDKAKKFMEIIFNVKKTNTICK